VTRSIDVNDAAFNPDLRACPFALFLEHGNDIAGALDAEYLACLFFVILDTVFFNEGENMAGRETGEGGLAKVRVSGAVVVGGHVEVREIAPPAAGDAYLGAGLGGMVQHEHRATPLSAFDGAQEARCPGADDDDVPFNQSLPKMETKFTHEGSKTQSLMNAKCRVQHGKVKIKGYEIMA
jgi:hypothetical protein